MQVLVGDWAAREVAKTQPTKLAALEGVGHGERGAPLHLLGWYSDGEVKAGIPIPKGLSLLAFHDPERRGRRASTRCRRPTARRSTSCGSRFSSWSSIGTFLAALSAWYLFTRMRRKRVPSGVWFYRLLVLAGPASVVALIAAG